MKIAIDLRTIMTGKLTGIETVGLEISKRLVKDHPKDKFIFWYAGRKNVEERLEEFKRLIDFDKLDNVKIVHWPISNLLLESSLMLGYQPKLDEMLGNPDVFWEPNPRSIPLTGKCKKVTTWHDLSMLVNPEFFSARSQLYMKLINLKREAQTSDKLIAVSQATKLDLIKFFQVPENKIEVVYNGVDEKYFIEPPRKLASEVRQKFALPAKYILFIGTIEPRKNLVTLIKAYRYMRDKWKVDMELVLAGGEGWQNHLRDVNEAIKEQKLTKKVKYLGRVSEDEKYALLHGASLLVYPSWYEGFGLPPLEAMAAGVPVVASNVSSIPEIVGDAALLADPADPEAIGKGMAQLILQTKLANSLKMQGKLQAHKFTWEKAAEKVYAILKGK